MKVVISDTLHKARVDKNLCVTIKKKNWENIMSKIVKNLLAVAPKQRLLFCGLI